MENRVSQNSLKKLQKLENSLDMICVNNNGIGVEGFTVMFNSESGATIAFRKNMTIDQIGTSIKFYDTNSRVLNSDNQNVKWPYTGFVIGSILGWKPISHESIIALLNNYNYSVNDFIRYYEDSEDKLYIILAAKTFINDQ